MSRNTFEDWIPEETGGVVITRVNQVSAVERFARREIMKTDVKNVPRSAGVGVAVVGKGTAYGEDTSANDSVTLTARKPVRAIRIAEEDLVDIPVDVVTNKQLDWATSYGKFVDNGTLAVTGAENGTTVPWTSVYYAATQNNSDTGYTANDNLTQTGSGGVTYANLSTTFGIYEDGDYADDSAVIAIAHPSFKAAFREIVDDNHRPILQEGAADGIPRLFGAPLIWSLGAKTSATATDTPAGNPLLIVGNRNLLILGIRSGPESVVIPPNVSLTDEAVIKMRARRGFAVGHEKAFSILEDNS